MNCTDCVQKDNHRYYYGEKIIGAFDGVLSPAEISLFDQKIKDRSQCNIVAQYSFDRTKVFIECCRPTRLNVEDCESYGLKNMRDMNAEEARAFKQTIINEFENISNLLK